ncbi:MAG: cyclic nucleotide-binding domain-containing protein [Fimbriimonadaceae bacterium]|nr:cyclic nucleotide-binding domain-containing protein [Fimbriimonadaceae bacterium]
MEDLSRLLSEHPFVHGLEARHVAFLLGCASNVVFQKGDFLFREGGPADKLYLVRYGSVGLQVHFPAKGTHTFNTVGDGEVVGWSWLVEPYVARFDSVALSTVRALALDAKCLRRKCDEDHELGYQMFARIAQVMERRLHAARLQLLDVYG